MIEGDPDDVTPFDDEPSCPRPDPEFLRRWFAAGCPPTIFGMAMSAGERAAKKRARRRRGVCVLDVEITEKQIAFLLDSGRIDEAGSRDRRALADAISALIEEFRHA